MQRSLDLPGPVEFMPPIDLRAYFGLTKRRAGAFRDVALTLRGRDAINLARRHFRLGRDDLVLLPGYVCDTVPAGFAGGCKIQYYDISDDFVIRPQEVEDRLSQVPVRVFYVVHYFGFLQPHLAKISEICRRHDVLLWEDHALSGLSHFPRDYADAMIFSFRKVLPVPDGGGLWLRDSLGTVTIETGALKSDIISLVILAKRMLCNASTRFRSAIGKAIQRNIDALNTGRRDFTPQPISRMTRRVVLGTKVEEAFGIHRDQYRQWLELLADGPVRPVFPVLPDAVCPQGCPVWLSNPDEIVADLEKRSVFLKIHWRSLPPEVDKTCPTAWRMSRSIVTLPIYAGLPHAEMRRIAEFIDEHAKPATV
jgi:hypothetical protein